MSSSDDGDFLGMKDTKTGEAIDNDDGNDVNDDDGHNRDHDGDNSDKGEWGIGGSVSGLRWLLRPTKTASETKRPGIACHPRNYNLFKTPPTAPQQRKHS